MTADLRYPNGGHTQVRIFLPEVSILKPTFTRTGTLVHCTRRVATRIIGYKRTEIATENARFWDTADTQYSTPCCAPSCCGAASIASRRPSIAAPRAPFRAWSSPRIAVASPAPSRPIGPFAQSRRAAAAKPGASLSHVRAASPSPPEPSIAAPRAPFRAWGGPRIAVAGPAPARPVRPFAKSRRAAAARPGASLSHVRAASPSPPEPSIAAPRAPFCAWGGPRVAVAGPAPARPIGPFVQSRRAGATLPGASYLVQLAGALRPVEGGLALRPALLRPAAAACARAARQAGRCCAACAHLKSGVTQIRREVRFARDPKFGLKLVY